MKRATAEQRTVSMFTGMTDVDAPDGKARDGSAPARIPEPTGKKPLKWEGGISLWYVSDGPRGRSYVVEKKGDVYHASYFSQKLGVFRRVWEAGDACSDHYDPRRSPTEQASVEEGEKQG